MLEMFFEDAPVYKDITYPDIDWSVTLKKGKPTDSWMRNWSQADRLDKYLEFLEAWDRREDHLLAQDYQIFSHRLHWHQHPFCDLMRTIDDLESLLRYCLTFSFSNEHWGTISTLIEHGPQITQEHFQQHRHARNDLFQIYYPKGTNVKEWLLRGPAQAAKALHHHLADLDRPWTMMEFAKLLEKHFKAEQNFRSPLYPCKNTARYMAMSRPDLVDPKTVLYGGTGHFDGLQQIFGGNNLNGKVKYEIGSDGEFIPLNRYANTWLAQMYILCDHSKGVIKEQHMLNHEDKTCFFYKHIAITHGVKKPTKRIPYNWIFPNNFNLANHPEGKVILNGYGYQQNK